MIHALAIYLAAATKQQSPEAASVRKCVQGFYDWYVPRALKGDVEMQTLKIKASDFTPTLRKALIDDYNAQGKSKDEVVGLDADPFLNSQDVANTYTVKKIEHEGHAWLASVYGHYKGQKEDAQPSVIAQVEKTKTGWRFTNFLVPEGGDLLKELRDLKKEREKH